MPQSRIFVARLTSANICPCPREEGRERGIGTHYTERDPRSCNYHRPPTSYHPFPLVVTTRLRVQPYTIVRTYDCAIPTRRPSPPPRARRRFAGEIYIFTGLQTREEETGRRKGSRRGLEGIGSGLGPTLTTVIIDRPGCGNRRHPRDQHFSHRVLLTPSPSPRPVSLISPVFDVTAACLPACLPGITATRTLKLNVSFRAEPDTVAHRHRVQV